MEGFDHILYGMAEEDCAVYWGTIVKACVCVFWNEKLLNKDRVSTRSKSPQSAVVSHLSGVQCPSVPQEEEGASWPDTGGLWEEEKMDCGLQAMAEEDEDIDFYNDETFGMGEEPRTHSKGVPSSTMCWCIHFYLEVRSVHACVSIPRCGRILGSHNTLLRRWWMMANEATTESICRFLSPCT